jgi:hypothetical protein
MDRYIHGMIVDTALCPLHPVDDTLACRVGYAASTYGYTRIVSQSDKLGRQFAVDLLAGHPTSVEGKILSTLQDRTAWKTNHQQDRLLVLIRSKFARVFSCTAQSLCEHKECGRLAASSGRTILQIATRGPMRG